MVPIKSTGKLLLFIIAISFGMLGLVEERVIVRDLEAEIRRIRSYKVKVREEISELRILKVRLKRSERIRKIAEKDLMMIFPDGAMKIIY